MASDENKNTSLKNLTRMIRKINKRKHFDLFPKPQFSLKLFLWNIIAFSGGKMLTSFNCSNHQKHSSTFIHILINFYRFLFRAIIIYVSENSLFDWLKINSRINFSFRLICSFLKCCLMMEIKMGLMMVILGYFVGCLV